MGATGRTGRPREFDRDAALEQAMTLFWRHGFEGVSIARLTEAIGIAPASLYAAFGSKAQLYAEALALYQLRPAAQATFVPEGDQPIRDFLRDMIEAAVAAATDPAAERGCMVSCGMLFHAPENAAPAQQTATIRRNWRERLAARLQRAMDAGEIDPTPDAAELSRYFASLMQGIAVQARDGATRAELMAVARIGVAGALRRG